MTFDFRGSVRLHFNRHGAAPLVWCLSTPTCEIAVKGFTTGVPVVTVYAPKATLDDEDGKPSAWLEPVAQKVHVRVIDGWAFIEDVNTDAKTLGGES